MEKERGHMTERILNLTLEIIYLLTGEDYTLVKKTSGYQMPPWNQLSNSGRCSRNQKGRRIKPSPLSKTPQQSEKKILEVTQKIIELLTGEVPIRCQDVTVYFSMEEWEYLEGHKDLYKDVMREKRPPLTSPDGSRNRNTPETCPRPLYSWDSTQEHQEIPQAHHLYSQDSTQEHQEVPQEHQEILEAYPLYSQDSTQKPQEIPQPCPLFSCDSTKEHQQIPREDQVEDVIVIKAEVLEEAEELMDIESYQAKEITPEIDTDPGDTKTIQRDIKGDDKDHGRLKEEEIAVEISTDGRYKTYKTEDCPDLSLNDVIVNNDITADPSVINTIPNVQPAPDRADLSSNPSTHEGVMTDHLYPGTYTVCKANGPFQCFVSNNCPGSHLISQPNSDVTPACPECGTSFSQASNVSRRGVTKYYPCSECGRCFSQKSNLLRHLRFHAVDKPYMCSACGRCFSQKSDLLRHQRIHTGEKPYSCLVCGRGFAQKSNLLRHHRSHSGEKPFSCTDCGKCFAKKQDLIAHQTKHTK